MSIRKTSSKPYGKPSSSRPLHECSPMGGSIPGPDALFEEEVQIYIETLQAIGANFQHAAISQPVDFLGLPRRSSWRRIYENTGLTSWTTDSEVLDEEKFN